MTSLGLFDAFRVGEQEAASGTYGTIITSLERFGAHEADGLARSHFVYSRDHESLRERRIRVGTANLTNPSEPHRLNH